MCLFIVEELRSLDFFLMNFQCLMEAVGSLSDILNSVSGSAIGFYIWKCERSNFGQDYQDDYFSDYLQARLVERLFPPPL